MTCKNFAVGKVTCHQGTIALTIIGAKSNIRRVKFIRDFKSHFEDFKFLSYKGNEMISVSKRPLWLFKEFENGTLAEHVVPYL